MSIKSKAILPVVLVAGITLSGCVKPYNKPKVVEIQSNQTAFVIPLEGKTGDQDKFQSEEYLAKNQVAAKRIKVTRTWYKTGWGWWKGKYRDDVAVLVVDRAPETREWLSDTTRGTSNKAEGFIGESKDSIKFYVGMSATASINEEDTAKFLYQYKGETLEKIMDYEIRNKIGTILLETYGSMSMKEIRENKKKVIETVRNDVVPYFKKRGITLSNIGYVGDLDYVDKDVQESINAAFIAEEKKKSQDIDNKREIEKAKADRKAIEERQATLEKSIKLRELEIQEEWIKKWNGEVPSVVSGNGSENFMLNIDNDNKKDK